MLQQSILWRGRGGREPGKIRGGDAREMGERARCGSHDHTRARGGRRMRDINIFNDFIVPFFSKQ